MLHKVFVCHSAKDKHVADSACSALEAQRIRCWIAPRDILAGEEYGKDIVEAISSCQIVLLIFSAHANKSPHVRREIERAVSKGKIIVPFRIEDSLPSDALEFALSNTHWLDALTPPLESHLTELCNTISRLIQKHKEPKPPLWTGPERRVTEQSRVIPVPVNEPTMVLRDKEQLPGTTNSFIDKVLAKWHKEAGEEAKNERQQDESRGRFRRWLLPGSVLAVGLASAMWYLHLPLPPPRVTEYVPLTHDSHILSIGGTDGSRIYFNSNPFGSIEQVGVSGGEIVRVPIVGPHVDVEVSDVSPDGSLLVQSVNPFGIWSVGAVGGSLRFITNHPVSHFRAWSPDGKSIAYFDEQGSLDVMRSDGTNVHKLLDVKGRITSIAWSPDGNRIRFTKDDALWEISSSGSNPHSLFPAWHGPEGQCCGRWTPDGDFFVFLVGRNSRIGTIASPRIGAFEQIWALDERHGLFRQAPREPVQLTSGPIHWDTPFPSKDGRKIFAFGANPRGELVRFDSKSNELRPFLDGISAEFVSFSRDGSQVAYVTFPDGVLWRAKRDGSERIQLASPPTYPVGCRWSRWSPDGTKILFTAPRNSSVCALYLVSAQGGNPEVMAPAEDGVLQGSGDWSPDGRRIVYHVGLAFSLYIFDLDRRETTKIPGSDGLYSPRWSRDGRYIAALTSDRLVVKLFDVKTQQWSTLVQNMWEEWSFPSWSQDGKFLYLLGGVLGGRAVFRVAVSGGKPVRVVDLNGFHSTGFYGFWFGLDPNDAPLLLRDIGRNEIYALTLERK